jgi:hypothetical protein
MGLARSGRCLFHEERQHGYLIFRRFARLLCACYAIRSLNSNAVHPPRVRRSPEISRSRICGGCCIPAPEIIRQAQPLFYAHNRAQNQAFEGGRFNHLSRVRDRSTFRRSPDWTVRRKGGRRCARRSPPVADRRREPPGRSRTCLDAETPSSRGRPRPS